MNLRRNDVAPASYSTCAWVFDHESYSSWLSQRRGLLWIKGKPGAGKSTLIKYILRQGKFPDDLAIASFYFHGRGAPMQRTPIGLFRSVLHQILIQIRPLLSKFYLVFKKKLESEGVPGKDWVWHERELQDFLELAVTSASKSCSIRIFVDALDECGEKAARDLVSYFRYLTLKLPPTESALSICFSCRHYPIVVLEHCLEICVEDRNYQDIKTYVREELGELQRGFPKDDVESLQEDIVNRSSGIFQWVSVIARQVLVLQQSGYSLNRIQKELQEKPTELDSLYQEMLKHIPGADRARSLQLMQWICFAERPLSLQELRFAMAFDADSPYRTLCQCQNSTAYIESDEQMKKLVKFLSGGLAEVKELGNRLAAQFIHQSVNDYLIQDGLQSLDNVSGSSVVGRGHHRLARSCIKYFATKEICHWSWEPVQLDNHYIYEFPFLRYAVLSWGTHAERAEAENIPQRDLLDYFQWPSDHILQCWARLHNKVASWSRLSNERPTLLHVASRYSLLSVLIATLKSEARVLLDVKDGSGQTALLRGAQSGHDSIVKLLIEKGAELDSKDNNGRTALSWATQFKRDSVVELLIGKGAELESRDNDGRTALSLAVESGSDSAAKLLIEMGAELDSKDNGGLTVLSWAAQGGHDSVVKLVVEKGAELESEDNGGRTALSWAARSGHDSVVKLLIEKGAELDSKDNGGLTALSWAAESRYDSVVKLLIEKGSKLDSKDNGGRTALSWAAKSGNDSILKLLIEKGAGLNYKDNGSLTALSRAAKGGYDSVVKLLIEKGAELDSKDNDGLTALSWATRNGHDSVAKLLIEKGAELDSKDNDGRTALSWAAMFGRDSAVKLLIEKGAELESKDKNGLMALSYAATFKHDPVVKLLVEKDAELESKGESGQTALSFAAESGSDSVVKLLIEKGAELDSKDNGGLTALSWATRNGHDSVVKLLIEKGAELGSKDNDGRTALSWAAMFGRDSAVKLLVEKGAELESEDNGGRTALSWATREWNNSTVKLLIEGGTRPDP
jgi:ankyrin repeat protein